MKLNWDCFSSSFRVAVAEFRLLVYFYGITYICGIAWLDRFIALFWLHRFHEVIMRLS